MTWKAFGPVIDISLVLDGLLMALHVEQDPMAQEVIFHTVALTMRTLDRFSLEKVHRIGRHRAIGVRRFKLYVEIPVVQIIE